MGLISVSKAIEVLKSAGLRAGRGYPGSIMPQIGGLAVAVNVEEEDSGVITFAARVCCPGKLGGGTCEDGAAQVRAVWTAQGGVCHREHCTYDGECDLFSVRVLGTWSMEPEPEPEPSMAAIVVINGSKLSHVTCVTTERVGQWSEQGAMGEAPLRIWQEQGWSVTVEELLPSRAQNVEVSSPFVLSISEGSKAERYPGCVWTSVLRRDTPEGVYQKRVCWSQTEGGNNG